MNSIQITELMQICKVHSPQVMLRFVKAHIEEINTDGEHAKKDGKSWQFDEVAVSRILQLRAPLPAKLAEQETPEQVELRQTRAVLQAAQQKIISLQESSLLNAENAVKLTQQAEQAEARAQVLAVRLETADTRARELTADIQALTSKKEALEADCEQLRATLAALTEQVHRQDLKLQELTHQLEAERNKGIIDKLFNR